MSQTSKIVIGIAAAVVVVLGGYYLWNAKHSSSVAEQQNAAANGPSTLPTGSSTSDAAIQQDISSIDAQLSAVQSDNAAASASVNDAVTQ